MTTFQRGLIETELQALEAGRFQELMLAFLPLYDQRFSGIQRLGGTEFGKTRGGVPDLLLTFVTGDQIGCECGTADAYWKPPPNAEKFPTWKPIADAEKCLRELARPIELVLASNRPLSPRYPNAKTIILEYLSPRTSCRITLFSSEDLAQWVEGNITRRDVLEVAEEFLPDSARFLRSAEDKIILDAAVEHIERHGFPIRRVVEILREAGPLSPGVGDVVTAEVLGDETRFLIEHGGEYCGIKRCEQHLPSLLRPFGRIVQLLGAPKIGKSFLVCESVALNECRSTWLQAPVDNRQEGAFVDATTIAILSQIWPRNVAVKFVMTGARPKQENARTSGENGSVFVILDNLHELQSCGLKRINCAIQLAKSMGPIPWLAIVLISNRNLTEHFHTIDETLVAPPWSPGEIGDFLRLRGIEIADQNPQSYLELLGAQCGGHPLFAASLARRYPDKVGLATNLLRGPFPLDVDLSNEIKNVLYGDILTSADMQNLVQRLSLLSGKAQLEVVEALRLEVEPKIATSLQVLYDAIGPAVLEGSLADGVRVSPVFRPIAQSRIAPREMREAFLAAANTLLTPREQIVDAGKAIDAVHYLMLSGDIGRAAMWALMLILRIPEDDPERAEHKAYLVSRLDLLAYVKDPPDQLGMLALGSWRVVIAHHYTSVERHRDAASILDRLDIRKLRGGKDSSPEIEGAAQEIETLAAFDRMFLLSQLEDPENAIHGFLDIAVATPCKPLVSDLLRCFPGLVGRLSEDRLAAMNFERLAQRLHPAQAPALAALALRVGFKAARHTRLRNALAPLERSVNTGPRLFWCIAHSATLLEDQQEAAALDALERSSGLAKADGVASLGAHWHQHRADVLYNLRNYEEAISEYRLSTSLADEEDTLCRAWNLYKIGIVVGGDPERVECLESAAALFLALKDYRNASRAKGALASHWLIAGEYEKAILVALELTEWFHTDKKMEVGPALRLLCANATRVSCEKAGRPIPGGAPPIDLRHFVTIIESAKPETGGVVTFQVLGILAETAGLQDHAIECFKKAIYSEVTSLADRKTVAGSWLNLCQYLGPQQLTQKTIADYLSRIVQYQPAVGSAEEHTFFETIVLPFLDGGRRDDETRAALLFLLVDGATQVIADLDSVLAERWAPYLAYCAGRAHCLLGRHSEGYARFRAATQNAIGNAQWKLGTIAGFPAAFELGRFHPSLLEAARTQHDLFLCIEALGLDQASVGALGKNLFKYWRRVDWRRLSERDLRAKSMLLDVAKELIAEGFSEDEAGPVLVASLLRAFDHDKGRYGLLALPRSPPPDVLRKLQ